jgi:hypothetical protein
MRTTADIVEDGARLWRAGMDTRSIASILFVREADVYNVIDQIKARSGRRLPPAKATSRATSSSRP